jgi:DNA-directed RNA polymerase subunit H (RpoH/RPB5)
VGAKPGDFIRITRTSETAGSTTYYRYVVEG